MQTKTPKISVLMSAYNSEKYIAEAIESILKQTFSDFEFIIINDGSIDDTPKIIERYAQQDKRILFINNKQNQGLIGALNQGLSVCRGEYIARMDSDDISLPTRFAQQVKYMDIHPECGALSGWIQRFGPCVSTKTLTSVKTVRLLDFLIHGCMVFNPCSMIRHSVLIKNNIKYNPEYKYAEDFGFWVEICKCSEIHNLQTVLLKYRWHDSNISVVHKKAQFECAERIRRNILIKLISSQDDIKKLLHMTREVNERFYLFGILPIVRRKQYSIFKTKYYLFEKIPLFKEKDGKIYLFEYIKIGKLK